MNRFGLVLHGDAGMLVSNDESLLSSIENALKEIITTAFSLLEKNESAIDVAEQTVILLEDSGIFNAGLGSCLTNQKTIEMDAGIMDGATLNCGGVGCIKNIKNPIKAARKVLDHSSHSLLVGNGAYQFVLKNGLHDFSMNPNDEQLKKFEDITLKKITDKKYGTVGVVVMDKKQNLASAVSTGGMWLKTPGRVGDSPIVGSGYYTKNNVCGVVSTGNGDAIMKICISKLICDLVELGNSIQNATDLAISELSKLHKGEGGVISIDHEGHLGISFNTKSMSRSYLFNDMDSPEVKIFE